MLHGALALSRACAGAGDPHRHHACARPPRRRRRGHGGRRARRTLVRADLRRLAGLRRGRGRGALRRRRAGRGGGGGPAHGARGRAARGRRVRSAHPGARPCGGARARGAARQSEAREPAVAFGDPARRRRRRARRERARGERHLDNAAHRAPATWSPRARWPSRCPTDACGLFTQGQGIFDDRRQVARFLGIAEDRIFVELVPNGGAFGGKEDMSVQAQTALLAPCHRPAR